MTAVSQIIPNFNGGINEQPDELKRPGQVRDCVNFTPDVTYGLIRRPGMEWVDKLDVKGNGTWIQFNKDNAIGRPDSYIGYVSKEGKVFVWDLQGEEQDVYYTNKKLEPGRYYTSSEAKAELSKRDGNDLTFDEFKEQYTEDGFDQYYLKHTSYLKYITCKENIILTNPEVLVDMNSNATRRDGNTKSNRYYSFVELTTFDPTRPYKFDVQKVGANPAIQRTVVDVTVAKSKGLDRIDAHLLVILAALLLATSVTHRLEY